MQVDIAPRRKCGVSLTPLIDVVFNLLLFFMLASSIARWSGLELATGSEAVDADAVPPARVQVLASGELRYDGKAYELSALADRLAGDLDADRISSVILRAEEDVPLHELIDSFDQLSHAGISGLALGEAAD